MVTRGGWHDTSCTGEVPEGHWNVPRLIVAATRRWPGVVVHDCTVNSRGAVAMRFLELAEIDER